ncbi:hypothetical protein ACOME3_007110 [Neoechinorhynchus agilis]
MPLCPYFLTNRICIIQEGYCHPIVNSQDVEADSTVTLITFDTFNVLVDTGGAWRKLAIQEAIKQTISSLDFVTYVVCTHGHSDHCGNLNLFPNAVHIVGFDMNHKQRYIANRLKNGESIDLADGLIKVVPTPGHTDADVSVIVFDDHFVVAIVGDLIECQNDEEKWQMNTTNQSLQLQSRSFIYERWKPAYIVPGHGPPFKL